MQFGEDKIGGNFVKKIVAPKFRNFGECCKNRVFTKIPLFLATFGCYKNQPEGNVFIKN